MKRLVLIAVIALSVCGCSAMGPKITRLDPGQGHVVVLKQLGRPDAVEVSGEYRIYVYLGRHATWHSPAHTDYTVILKDDRVVQFGPGLPRRVGIHSWAIVRPAD